MHTSSAARRDTLHVCIAGTCFDGECEGLHLPVQERHQHMTWSTPQQPKVIVTAGQFVWTSDLRSHAYASQQTYDNQHMFMGAFAFQR